MNEYPYIPTYQKSKNNPSVKARHVHGTVSARYVGAAAAETPVPNPITHLATMNMAIFTAADCSTMPIIAMIAATSSVERLPMRSQRNPLTVPANAFPTITMDVFSAVVTLLRWK